MIEKYIEEGYISKRKHPEENLYILNYTPKTQYEGFWNEHTISCRGLIVDSNYNPKARCFKKFFNYEEVRPEVIKRKNIDFEIHEKIDGSLGILYWAKDRPFIATRGSFDSEQALVANKILESYDTSFLDKSLTYLFEIIYPENRICVDYGFRKDLIFLTAFEIHSGKEVDLNKTPFIHVKKYKFEEEFENIKDFNWPNHEGFVVKFSDGFRFKIKFEEYRRLHQLVFSISTRSIWESLRLNKKIELEKIPDETYNWIKKEESLLQEKYRFIEFEAKQYFSKINHLSRKEFANHALEYRYPSILFKMLDEKPHNDIIWKIIEPEYRTPNEKIQKET